MSDGNSQERMLESFVRESDEVSGILKALREADDRLHVGAGLVRNLTWDRLHGYAHSTAVDDVDVVYFDTLDRTKQHDEEFERRLAQIRSSVRWSVRNQARMHTRNDEPEYRSLEDAISKWPEVCTAIAVRCDEKGDLHWVAPYGFGDLFRLVVRPTDHFQTKIDAYRERVASKQWEKTWPRLLILDTA